MTENQIIIICFVGFWMYLSLLAYTLLLKYTRKEYRKFYPHPIVNIVKELNSDSMFNFWEKLFIFTCLNIVYLPIICEWLIAWCLYKFWKFVYIDGTAEQKSIEDVTRIDPVDANKDYEIKVEKHAREIEEALDNPEAMPRMDSNEDRYKSE